MTVIGLDPGTTKSALVIWDGQAIRYNLLDSNDEVLQFLRSIAMVYGLPGAPVVENKPMLVIEQIKSYGMSVGDSVFETCYWSGRFAQAYGIEYVRRLPRIDVKMHLCKSPRANDAAIRTSLIDRFGGKEKAIGKKASKGPLYKIKNDLFAALGVALTYHDQNS